MGHGVRVARLKKGRLTRQPRRSKRRASKGPRPTLRQRWQNTSLKASFMVYVAFYLIIALIGSIVSSSFFAELRTGVESNEEVSGLYLFDSDDGMLYRARIIEVAVGKDVDGSPVFCTAFVQRSSDPSDALDPKALPDRCVLSDVTGLPGNAVVYVVEAQGAIDFDTFSIGLDTTMLSRPAMELSPDTLAVYDELARARFNKTLTEPLTTYAESAYSNGIAISPVAYNVYVMTTVQQRIAILGLGVMSFLMFPLWFVGCIWIAARRFFAQRIAPALTGLDAAAEKITEQDLDFTVSYPRDDEMGNLVQSFEIMRTSLAQTQRAMWHTAEEHRRLNAAFAHDLRTPLTVLHGKLELLETRAAGSKTIDPERLAQDCRALTAQVERLEAYVAAMSSVRRLEDRPITRAPLDLPSLQSELDEAGLQLCGRSEVSFTFEPTTEALPLALDRSVVIEVAENLLGNAARHAGTAVKLTLETTPEELVLCVSDDGPGFSAEALQQGCEPFYSEHKNEGHFGLGLNISHLLCEKHGGSLTLSNRPEGGAQVVARFKSGPRGC